MLVPNHTQSIISRDYPEHSQQKRNASYPATMWLHTPTTNKEHRSGRKRKHEEPHGDFSNNGATLCWPNAALRECMQVTISRTLYTNLKQLHVADLIECFCVTEGYDIFESENSEPLFIDGVVFDVDQLHVVSKYTGNPLPDFDIFFPDSSDDLEDLGESSMDVVCWPNPLLGECKEAAISHTELNDLISDWDGNDFPLDTCTCASEGFSTAITTKKKDDAGTRKTPPEEPYTGVQTYAHTPRVTLCFFGGTTSGYGKWEVEGGSKIQKGALCKQVTIDHGLYNQRVMKRFLDTGVSECKGGCVELGYSVLMESASRQVVTLRPGKKKSGRKTALQLIPHRCRKTSPGEWVHTYHSIDYDPRVTLCLFDGEEVKDSRGATLWWDTNDGAFVRKRELCKQVTTFRDLYVSTPVVPGRKERFNKCGIYECGDGGCAQMGYASFQESVERVSINIREDTPAVAVGGVGGGRTGKGFKFPVVPNTVMRDKQARGARIDTYVSTNNEG